MIEYLAVAVPDNILDRSGLDQEKLKDFERVTGIKKTRHFEGSTTEMVKKALDKCNLDPTTFDGVIVLTQSPDRLSPCLAVEIHSYLEMWPHAFAFDVNRACTGWIDGVHLAAKLGRVLLICVDRLRYNPNPAENLIFSDSVSVTVINDWWEFYPEIEFHNDGQYAKELYCGLNGDFHMNGSFIFDFVVGKVSELIKQFNQEYPCDLLVPHQANLSMLKLLAIRSGFKDKWLSSIEEYGNQSMNSIPMAILHNEEDALGRDLLLAGFGAGVSASLMKIRWSHKTKTEIVEI